MANTPAEYGAELRRILDDLDSIVRTSETAMTTILDDARATIQGTLASLDLESPTRTMLERAQAGVDEALAAMRARLEAAATEATGAAFEKGADLATRPLGAEFTVATAAVTTDRLAILTRFSADLIQAVSDDTRRRINGELISVVAGAKTPGDAAKAIGRNLTDPNHFRTIAHRARAILTTEVGRAQALGTQGAQEQLAAAQAAAGGPEVRKRWINAHLPGARATHLAAENRYAPAGDPGPIPVDQPFVINGTPALYPRDPSLPAGESVNCHCISISVLGPAAATPAGEPAVLTDDQWDALNPDKYRSFPTARDETAAALNTTQEGRRLHDTLDRWIAGDRQLANIRTDLEHIVQGGAVDTPGRERANLLLNALRQSPHPPPETLYRGMYLRGADTEAIIAKYFPEGDTIDMTLSSFTKQQKVANTFASWGAQHARGAQTQVLVEWRGAAKQTMPVRNAASTRKAWLDHEWIAGGRFRVVETHVRAGKIRIVLEQEEGL